MRFNVSNLVEQLRLAHRQMTRRNAATLIVEAPVETRRPEPKRRPQVATHKPADDYRLRASQL
jgi:hypothetical protein